MIKKVSVGYFEKQDVNLKKEKKNNNKKRRIFFFEKIIFLDLKKNSVVES